MDWSQIRAAGAPRASIAFRARIASRMVAVSAGRAGERARAILAWVRSLRIPPGRIMLWCAPGTLMGAVLLLSRLRIVPKDCTDTIIVAALLGHGVLAWILAADQEGRIRAQREAWRAEGGTIIEGAAEAESVRLSLLESRLMDAEERLRQYDAAWTAMAPKAMPQRHLAVVPLEAQELP